MTTTLYTFRSERDLVNLAWKTHDGVAGMWRCLWTLMELLERNGFGTITGNVRVVRADRNDGEGGETWTIEAARDKSQNSEFVPVEGTLCCQPIVFLSDDVLEALGVDYDHDSLGTVALRPANAPAPAGLRAWHIVERPARGLDESLLVAHVAFDFMPPHKSMSAFIRSRCDLWKLRDLEGDLAPDHEPNVRWLARAIDSLASETGARVQRIELESS